MHISVMINNVTNICMLIITMHTSMLINMLTHTLDINTLISLVNDPIICSSSASVPACSSSA